MSVPQQPLPLSVTLTALQSISRHADNLIGHGEFRRFSLDEIEKDSRSNYARKRVYGISGCGHVLIFESRSVLYYPLEGNIYLRVCNA